MLKENAVPCNRVAIATLLLAVSVKVLAQNVGQCDAALAPTIEKAASDYALAQSYMYVNAALEYDKLKRSSAEERGTSASYKFFGAEYNESKSSSEFQEKIRDRLKRENFSMSESESRSSYRRYLSGPQLSAWSSCVQSVTRGGAVILLAESVSSSAFPIRVRWYPPAGVGTGTLVIRIRNGTIDDTNHLQVQLQGATEKAFIVEPDTSTRQIVLTAEIMGTADTLALPRAFPPAEPPKPSVIGAKPKTRMQITVPAADFVRPLNVALGGPNNTYGADVLLNGPPYNDRPNRAEFEFNASAGGTYLLKVEYAAADARPVRILLNGEVVIAEALGSPTGCWTTDCQRVLNQGRLTLREGINVLRVERGSVFPHIRKFVFEPMD